MNANDRERLLNGPPPTEFLVMAFGTYDCPGRLVFDPVIAKQCVRNAVNGQVAIADACAFEDTTPIGYTAIGWAGLEVREDGLYACRVEWAASMTSLRRVVAFGLYPTIALKMGAKNPTTGEAIVARALGIGMTNTPTPGCTRPLVPIPEPAKPASDPNAPSDVHEGRMPIPNFVAGYQTPAPIVDRYPIRVTITSDGRTRERVGFVVRRKDKDHGIVYSNPDGWGPRGVAYTWDSQQGDQAKRHAKRFGGSVLSIWRNVGPKKTEPVPVEVSGAGKELASKAVIDMQIQRDGLQVEVNGLRAQLQWAEEEKARLTRERDERALEAYHLRDQLMSTSATLALVRAQFDSWDKDDEPIDPLIRIARLRKWLIESGRNAGALLVDEVSDNFLRHIPHEVKGKLARVTKERDDAIATNKASQASISGYIDEVKLLVARRDEVIEERDRYRRLLVRMRDTLAEINGVKKESSDG